MTEENPILVIEDDEASAFYLEEIIGEIGIPVLIATTAAEALKILEKDTISLIFMDIRLPDINGYDLTERLRKKGMTLPIIAQTAFVMSDEREKALNAGCDDYLSKPLRKDVLWKTLSKHLKIKLPS